MKRSRKKLKGIKVRQRVKSSVASDKKAEQVLESRIKKVSVNARRRAIYNNAPVTIIRNGKIIRISTGKKETVLGKVRKPRLTVDVTKALRIK